MILKQRSNGCHNSYFSATVSLSHIVSYHVHNLHREEWVEMENTILVFFYIKFIRRDQKQCCNVEACRVNQGPVVQSIVSLTSSLRGQLVKCFRTL